MPTLTERARLLFPSPAGRGEGDDARLARLLNAFLLLSGARHRGFPRPRGEPARSRDPPPHRGPAGRAPGNRGPGPKRMDAARGPPLPGRAVALRHLVALALRGLPDPRGELLHRGGAGGRPALRCPGHGGGDGRHRDLERGHRGGRRARVAAGLLAPEPLGRPRRLPRQPAEHRGHGPLRDRGAAAGDRRPPRGGRGAPRDRDAPSRVRVEGPLDRRVVPDGDPPLPPRGAWSPGAHRLQPRGRPDPRHPDGPPRRSDDRGGLPRPGRHRGPGPLPSPLRRGRLVEDRDHLQRRPLPGPVRGPRVPDRAGDDGGDVPGRHASGARPRRNGGGSRSSCASRRRWRRSAGSRAASPTTSTTCSR